MCLIVVAWQAHATHDLLLAANRDEFHARPTRAAHIWADPPGLVAGRDEKAGGAWCGADQRGRFAAVTNIRDPQAGEAGPALRSRGALVRDYFAGDWSAQAWAAHVADNSAAYGPFNLLVGDQNALYHVANRGQSAPRAVAPGVLAISNGLWGDHWPKTEKARQRMQQSLADDTIAADTLLTLLADTDRAPLAELPDTGIDRDAEHFLSAMFIKSPTYGTRAASVIRRDRAGHIDFTERGFDPAGQAVHRVHHNWLIETRST